MLLLASAALVTRVREEDLSRRRLEGRWKLYLGRRRSLKSRLELGCQSVECGLR